MESLKFASGQVDARTVQFYELRVRGGATAAAAGVTVRIRGKYGTSPCCALRITEESGEIQTYKVVTAYVGDALSVVIRSEQIDWSFDTLEVQSASGLTTQFESSKVIERGSEVELWANWEHVDVRHLADLDGLAGTTWNQIDGDASLSFLEGGHAKFFVGGLDYSGDRAIWYAPRAGQFPLEIYWIENVACTPSFGMSLVDNELRGDYLSVSGIRSNISFKQVV